MFYSLNVETPDRFAHFKEIDTDLKSSQTTEKDKKQEILNGSECSHKQSNFFKNL